MTDEMKALRNTVELAIAGGSLMVALMCLCLSYLATGTWGPFWATFAIVSMGFCVAWTFDDFIFTSKKKERK